MRKLLTLLLIVGCFTAYSAPQKVTLKVSNGTWAAASWDPRLPTHGDTIIIPINTTLTVSQDISLNNVLVEIYGSLVLSGNNLKFDLLGVSKLRVHLGGRILGSKNSQHLILGVILFKGDNGIIVGPVEATDITKAFVPFIESIIPLPIKYLGFSAARKNADVLVQWATSQEVNADSYEVERSDDGSTWKTVGKVKATGSSTYATNNYTYTDKNVGSGTVYYRIRQIDLNGRYEYTAIKTVRADGNNYAVNAMAAGDNVVLQFSKQVPGQVEVRLVSLSGQVVSRQFLSRPVGQIVMPVTMKGHFILSVSNDQQDIQMYKQILL